MLLYLFRHGIAHDADKYPNDAARPLTREGVHETTAAAKGLAHLIDRPKIILTSPRLRAIQTAEILGEAFDRTPIVVEEIGVDDPDAIAGQLRQRAESSMMAVGHEPTLSTLALRLVGTRGERGGPEGPGGPGGIELKKAGCIALQVDWGKSITTSQGALLWLATPEMLQAIKK